MLKIEPALNFAEQSQTKCGEIYCQSFTDLTFCCCFCNTKLFAFDDFLLHLQKNHFENKACKDEEILQEYDENKVFSNEELFDEECWENFKDVNELPEEIIEEEDLKVLQTEIKIIKENNEIEDISSEDNNLEVFTNKHKTNELLGEIDVVENSNECLESIKTNSNKHKANELLTEIDVVENSNECLESINTNSKILEEQEMEIYIESSEDEEVSNDALNTSQYHVKQAIDNILATMKKPKKKERNLEYACPECQEIFNLMWLLDDHIIDVHGGHKCTICNKRFGKRHHLTRHKLTHNNERTYSCTIPECGKSFTVLEYCKRHIENHNKERLYTCPIIECGKTFADKGYFKRHVKKHQTNGTHLKDIETRYVCDQCGYGFASFFALNTHQRLHTGEKPFQCNFCEKRYISKSSLKNHMISHKTIRNFICNICQARFKRNISLKRHQYIHREERNFKCELCDAAFKQPHGLQQHVMYVHKGKKDVRVRRKRNKETVEVKTVTN